MAQVLKREFFDGLLTHEIKELSRIKEQLNLAEHIPAIDNLTIAVVPVEHIPAEEAINSVKGVLRDSDVMFPSVDHILLLLPGTDEMGAIHVLEGLADFLTDKLKFSYVVYPNEGTTAEELIEALKRKSKAELGLDLPELG